MKAIFSLTALWLILASPAIASDGHGTTAPAVTSPAPVQASTAGGPARQPAPRLLAWDRVGSPVSSLSSFT